MRVIGFITGLFLLAACGREPINASKQNSGSGGNAGRLCTMESVAGLAITVDFPHGTPTKDLRVTLKSEHGEEVLTPANDYFGKLTSASWSTAGAWEAPGTYSITASVPGLKPVTKSGVKVVSDGCHVDGVLVTLTLNP